MTHAVPSTSAETSRGNGVVIDSLTRLPELANFVLETLAAIIAATHADASSAIAIANLCSMMENLRTEVSELQHRGQRMYSLPSSSSSSSFSLLSQSGNRSCHISVLGLSSNKTLLLPPSFRRCCPEMLTSLLVAYGKQRGRSLCVASDVGPLHGHLLHLRDRIPGQPFIPTSSRDRNLRIHTTSVQAVTGTAITTIFG